MRERFRVRSNNKGSFVECSGFFPFQYNFSEGKFVPDEQRYAKTAKLLELIHSTGKFDMNGKMIYEGDILKIYNRNEWIVKCTWQPNPCWYVYQKSNGVTMSLDCRYPVEVIGHIKENPDLFLNS